MLCQLPLFHFIIESHLICTCSCIWMNGDHQNTLLLNADLFFMKNTLKRERQNIFIQHFLIRQNACNSLDWNKTYKISVYFRGCDFRKIPRFRCCLLLGGDDDEYTRTSANEIITTNNRTWVAENSHNNRNWTPRLHIVRLTHYNAPKPVNVVQSLWFAPCGGESVTGKWGVGLGSQYETGGQGHVRVTMKQKNSRWIRMNN